MLEFRNQGISQSKNGLLHWELNPEEMLIV